MSTLTCRLSFLLVTSPALICLASPGWAQSSRTTTGAQPDVNAAPAEARPRRLDVFGDGQFGLVNGFVSAHEFNVEGDRVRCVYSIRSRRALVLVQEAAETVATFQRYRLRPRPRRR